MEKIFTPNRIFVLFCAALVAIWASLQVVSNQLLSTLAERDAKSIMDWSWPDLKLSANVDSIRAEVTSRSATEARVKVSARQILRIALDDGTSYKEVGKPTECSATLRYYRNNQHWILGGVELP
jgi:hypothetical protein